MSAAPEGADDRWKAVISGVRAVSQERTRREARRRRLGLLWKAPFALATAIAVGVGASLVGVPRQVMLLLVGLVMWAFATVFGSLIAGGGGVPRWELDAEPMPVRRYWIGAAIGFAAGAALFVVIMRGA